MHECATSNFCLDKKGVILCNLKMVRHISRIPVPCFFCLTVLDFLNSFGDINYMLLALNLALKV